MLALHPHYHPSMRKMNRHRQTATAGLILLIKGFINLSESNRSKNSIRHAVKTKNQRRREQCICLRLPGNLKRVVLLLSGSSFQDNLQHHSSQLIILHFDFFKLAPAFLIFLSATETGCLFPFSFSASSTNSCSSFLMNL